MRILMTIHHYKILDAGAPGATLLLARALNEQGHEVSVFGFEDFKAANAGPLTQMTFPWFLAAQPRRIMMYDVIDASTGDGHVLYPLFRTLFRKQRPLLVTRCHGLEHLAHVRRRMDAKLGRDRLTWKYPIYHGGLRLHEVARSLRSADLSLFLNEDDRSYATQRLHVSRTKTKVLPAGIDGAFLEHAVDMKSARNSGPHIVWMGSWIPRKAPDIASTVITAFLRRDPTRQAHFLGTGVPDDRILAMLPSEVHAQVSITSTYVRADLPSIFRPLDILLFPSRSEGFPVTVLEAMACGLTPILSAIPAVSSFAQHGVNALLAPLDAADSFESFVETLMANHALRLRIATSAMATARSLSWATVANRTAQTYAEVSEERTAAIRRDRTSNAQFRHMC